jgi:hypothetical protein
LSQRFDNHACTYRDCNAHAYTHTNLDKYSYRYPFAAVADPHGNADVDTNADEYAGAFTDSLADGYALPFAHVYTLADGDAHPADTDGDADGDAIADVHTDDLCADAALRCQYRV